MGELEFKQQNLRKLESSKEQLMARYKEAIEQKDYWDTTAKNIGGGLMVLDGQINELKLDIQTFKKEEKLPPDRKQEPR